jgi:4-carboxymuconolactone decarboxylase
MRFVEDRAGLRLGPAGISARDPKTAALLQIAVSAALGSPAVCPEWSAGRALAAGASEDEIAEVLLAIAPVAGLGRVVAAAPEVATALGYDIAAALEEPPWRDGRWASMNGVRRPGAKHRTPPVSEPPLPLPPKTARLSSSSAPAPATAPR